MGRDSRVYVKASPEEQEVFHAVAEAIGQDDNMSAAIRFVMFEKARELGLMSKPASTERSCSSRRRTGNASAPTTSGAPS